jgi:cytochrome c oxidase subunit I+III
MTATVYEERLERMWQPRRGVLGWLMTTDHKRIGLLYFWTTLVFFGAGGAEALLVRTQLIAPNQHLVGPATYDELFTMHGLTMIFFFIIPMTTGAFGNYLLPLMIGARDMAFPRLNALSYWVFVGSGIFIYTSLFLGMAPNAGWFDYVPLANATFDPGHAIDFFCLGIIFNGISSSLTAANFIVTIFKLRAPGMSFNRMPLFCFAFLAASFGLLFALPSLTADTIFLFLDRNVGMHFFDVAHGGSALLWQHLFWIFGHPEVYILIVPAFGIATEIIPAFTQRRIVAFPLVAVAELLVVFIGFGVWAHHMFATGMPAVTVVFFAAATAIVVIPSTVQVFAWCMTFITGRARFSTPLLFIAGFIFMFVAGGLTGIMFLAVPFDQQVTDTYFVVAHFHYIIFGAAVFPIFAGMYFWFPKVTGKLYFELPGQISFWTIFLGTNLLFFPMHVVGLEGMTRRVYTYPGGLGWGGPNLLETIGSYITTVGIVVLLANLVVSYFRGPIAGPDPWHGATLEWTTSSPPPEYNFAVIPKVSSAYANWDVEDREEDRRRLEQGVMVLEQGHEQPLSSPVDGWWAATAQMAHDSVWPILLGFALSLVFVFVLLHLYTVACVGVGIVALTLLGWHAEKPHGGVGVWGMGMLIASEATLFGTFIGTYYYLRFTDLRWPPAGTLEPRVVVPLVMAGVLATSSLPMWLAAKAVRVGRLLSARVFVLLALLVQCGYLGYEIHDYVRQLGVSRPQGSAYSSIYYTLLGADHAHVFIGILLSVWLLANLRATRVVALYWHAVNVLTLIVIGVIASGAA